MPRIPEGNFNSEPSSRVPNQNVPRINVSGATQRLRGMGKQFLGVANQMDKTKQRVDSLAMVESADNDMSKLLIPQLDGLPKNSKNGKLLDADGEPTGDDIVDAGQKAANDYLTKQRGKLAGNHEALKDFESFVAPNVQAKVDKLELTRAKQFVSYAEEGVDKKYAEFQGKLLTGDINNLSIAEMDKFIDDRKDILGTARTSNLKESYKTNAGLMAPQALNHMGYTPENYNMLKGFITKFAPPEQQERLTSALDATKDRLQIGQENAAITSYNKLVKATNTVEDYVKSAAQWNKAKDPLMRNPFSEKETSESRIAKLAPMLGKEMFFKTMGNIVMTNQEIDNQEALDRSLVTTKGGEGVLKRDQPERLKLNDKEFLKSVDVQMKEIERHLASTGVADIVDMTALKNEVTKQAKLHMFAYKQGVENDAFGTFNALDPQLAKDINSPNEAVANAANVRLQALYAANGVPEPKQRLASGAAGKLLGKQIVELSKGDRDASGITADKLMSDATAGPEDMRLKKTRDLIDQSGGSKNGDPSIPPAYMAVAHVGNDSMRTEFYGDFNTFDDNLLKLPILDEDDKSNPERRKTSFNKKFLSTLTASKATEIYNIDMGRVGENTSLSQGYMKLLEVRTASYMTPNGGNKDMEEAVKQARADLQTHIPMVNGSGTTVALDPEKFKQSNIDIDDLPDTIEEAKDLEGIDVDYKRMAIHLDKHSDFGHAVNLIQQSKSPAVRKVLFDRLIRENIIMANDPDNKGMMKAYIKPLNSNKPIPILKKTKSQDGRDISKHIRIDLLDFHAKINSESN